MQSQNKMLDYTWCISNLRRFHNSEALFTEISCGCGFDQSVSWLSWHLLLHALQGKGKPCNRVKSEHVSEVWPWILAPCCGIKMCQVFESLEKLKEVAIVDWIKCWKCNTSVVFISAFTYLFIYLFFIVAYHSFWCGCGWHIAGTSVHVKECCCLHYCHH